MDKDRTVIGPGIDPIVGTMVSTTIGEEGITIITIMIGTIGPTTEMEIGQGMPMEISEMMDKIIEEIIIHRIMVAKGTEIEVQVKTMVGQGKDIEVIHGTTQIQEIDTVIIAETKAEIDRGPILVTGKIVEQSLDQAHV